MPSGRPAAPGWLARWESTAALLLIAAVYSAIQAATPNIVGIDGYYHIKVAWLMREQGWRLLAPLDFPWLQLTILGPGRYTDHHFLFHLLQVPFTFGDLRVGAKMAAVLFAVGGLYTIYLFLARQGARYPALWIAVLVATAPTFLWRQSMARTQSLSLLLMVAGLWALFAGRPRLLLAVGFLAAWLFNGFFFVVGAPAAAVLVSLAARLTGRWLRAETPAAAPPLRVALAALGWTLLGLALGLLLHPYFPRDVEFAFYHLLPKAVPAEQPDVPVGQEWYPYSLSGFVMRVGPTAALTLLALVPIGWALWRRRWPDWRTLVLGVLALGFLGMVARSQRLIEYFPAFAVMFAALSWSSVPLLVVTLGGPRWLGRLAWPGRAAPALGAPGHAGGLPIRANLGGGPLRAVLRCAGRLWPWLVALLLAPAVLTSVQVAGRQADGGLAWTTYREGALWLAANTPPGSRVFTTGWDDFPHMFYWNTHNTYLTGLDPTYMSLEDPELYRLWRAISNGQVQRPAQAIRERFDAPYVLSDLKHERFLRVAAADPDLEEVLRTRTVVVFRVRGG